MGCNTSNARGNHLRWAFSSIILGANKFWTSAHKLLVKVGDFLPKKSLVNKKSKQKGGFNPTTMISDSILKRSYVHIGSVNWMAAPSRANAISHYVQACGAGFRGREDPTCTETLAATS